MHRTSIMTTRLLAAFASLFVGLALLVVPAGSATAAGPGEFYVGWSRNINLGTDVSLYPEGSDTAVVPLSYKHRASFYRAKVPPGRYTVCWTSGTYSDIRPHLGRCLGADGKWVERRSEAVTIRVPSGGRFGAPRIDESDRVFAGRVTGQVVSPDGVPVRRAKVCALAVDPEEEVEACTVAATTDVSGRFAMNQLSPDRVSKLAVTTEDGQYATSYVGDTADLAEATVVPFTPGTARHLPATTMQTRDVPRWTGTVRDTTGRPISDAVVTARKVGDDTTFTHRQGGKGAFALGLDPGTYDVTTTARGFSTSEEQVEITADFAEDIVLGVRKGEYGTVRATVVLDGKPLVGATIYLTSLLYGDPKIYKATTDADGVSVRRDVKPGKYFAYIEYKGTYVGRMLKPVVPAGLNHPYKFTVVSGDTPVELDVTSSTATSVVSLRSPSILQEPVVGAWLTADGGRWAPAAVEISYQWMRGGAPIAGATGPGYRVQPSDAYRQIWVQVTATSRNAFNPTTRSSKRVTIQPKPAPPEPQPAAQATASTPSPTAVPEG